MPAAAFPTARLRRLGAELHRLREAAGLTLEEAGLAMERSPSSLSKMENGRVGVYPRDLRVILDAYGVTDSRKREALLALARDARKRGWWHQYGDALSPAYADFISLEADALALRTFETVLIPGLLQTEDYARAVIDAVPSRHPAADVDQLVAIRMARQQVLTRDDPLQLWAIVDEAALLRPVGGGQVMRTQLLRLVETARLSHVTLQVLPYTVGAHAGIDGPFTILEFPEFGDLDVVVVEHLTSGLYLELEEEVRRYNVVFDHLRASALPPADSAALIEQVAADITAPAGEERT